MSLFRDPERKGWSCKEGPTPLVSMAVCFILGLCKVHFLEDDSMMHQNMKMSFLDAVDVSCNAQLPQRLFVF